VHSLHCIAHTSQSAYYQQLLNPLLLLLLLLQLLPDYCIDSDA
jgi:hypothetical protein